MFQNYEFVQLQTTRWHRSAEKTGPIVIIGRASNLQVSIGQFIINQRLITRNHLWYTNYACSEHRVTIRHLEFRGNGDTEDGVVSKPGKEAVGVLLQSASFDGMYCNLDGDENEAVEAASGLVQSPHSTDTR